MLFLELFLEYQKKSANTAENAGIGNGEYACTVIRYHVIY